MAMTTMQIEIETVLRSLGAKGTQKGFWGIFWGVIIAMEDPAILCSITKRLYPAVGERCGLSGANVGRDMRSLVDWCWNEGDREAFQILAGRKILDKPTVGEFIDLFAAYMRRNGY